MKPRRARLPACTLVLALSVAACSPQPAEAPFEFCAGVPTRLTVYNYYADHTNADVQTITDPGELSDICTYQWNDLGAERKLVDQALLGQRSVTVLVLSPGRTFWVYRLPGFAAANVVRTSTGETYLVPNHAIPAYYAAAATPISRDLVPQP